MQKFANIDTVMEPAQISQTMSQDQTPSSGRDLMRSVTGRKLKLQLEKILPKYFTLILPVFCQYSMI